MDHTILHALPQASLDQSAANPIERVASGQKLIIYAILLNFTALVLQVVVDPIAGLLGLVAVVLTLIGVFRLSSGMGMSLLANILLVVLMLVPFVNLITLLIVNLRATAALRSAGYKVSLLGASK